MFDQMAFVKKVYPLNRTLVSDDTDLTLAIIKEHLPERFKQDYRIIKIPSGKRCWTWITPKKYIVKEAYIKDETGEKIVDYKDNYLHLCSYSKPVNKTMSFSELDKHLFYSKERPNAIPFKYLFYVDDWGFALSFNNYLKLDRDKKYKVVIDSSFKKDFLKIGELFLKGNTDYEFLIMTNICHPCQVNDSISGVSAVLDFLHRMQDTKRSVSLRILFFPETIGSVCYFACNEGVEKSIRFGMFTEMLGNDNSLALQKSYNGNSYIDFVAQYVFGKELQNYRIGNFREIVGNDELITNGPDLNIPTISISRSKKAFECYPEYHTSDDNPDILIEDNLKEAAGIFLRLFEVVNSDYIPKRKFKGPLFLTRYGLWGIWGELDKGKEYVDKIMYLMEGKLSVFEISREIGLDYWYVKGILDSFLEKGVIEKSYG